MSTRDEQKKILKKTKRIPGVSKVLFSGNEVTIIFKYARVEQDEVKLAKKLKVSVDNLKIIYLDDPINITCG